MAPPVLSPPVGFRISVVILRPSALAYAHGTLQEVATRTELICGLPNTKQNTENETTCDISKDACVYVHCGSVSLCTGAEHIHRQWSQLKKKTQKTEKATITISPASVV